MNVKTGLEHLRSVNQAYRNVSDMTFGVDLRIPADGVTPPKTSGISANTHNFLLDTCDPAVVAMSSALFDAEACRNTSTFGQIRQIKTAESDGVLYMLSFVVMLQYQTLIFNADREVFNGPLNPSLPGESELALDTLISHWTRDCYIDPKVLTRTIDLYRALRGLARSSAQLHWLFEFGYSTHNPTLLEQSNEEFDKSMALFMINVVELERRINDSPPSSDEAAYRLSRLERNVAKGYSELNGTLKLLTARCESREARLVEMLRAVGREAP